MIITRKQTRRNNMLIWENVRIDLNDYRISNYVFFIDYNGLLNIMNKQTFNIVKFRYIKEKDIYTMYNSESDAISTFTDIQFILSQFWNCGEYRNAEERL